MVHRDSPAELADEAWDRVIETNLTSIIRWRRNTADRALIPKVLNIDP